MAGFAAGVAKFLSSSPLTPIPIRLSTPCRMVGFAAEAAKFFWFCFFFGMTLAVMTAYGILVGRCVGGWMGGWGAAGLILGLWG